jgi:uncharacterized protein YfaS (alpha-2-macroglobulin family)
MPRRLRFAGLLCLAAATLAQAAGTPAPPQVEVTEAYDGNVTLTFDQPMLTWRGESDTAGLALQPAVECRWFWEDDTILACQVPHGSAKPLRHATPYRLQLPGGLWSQAGVELAPTELTVVTALPELDLRVRDWRDGQPELIVISGDMPVSMEDMAQVLELRLDGAQVAYTLKPLSPRQLAAIYASPEANAFAVVPTDWPTAPGTLVVSVREGLRSSAGPLRGEAEVLLRTPVNEPLRLAGIACSWSRLPMTPAEVAKAGVTDCSPDATVSLAFTRRLAPGEGERIAAALPGLTFKEGSQACGVFCGEKGARFSVNFTSQAAGVRLPISLPADLRADDGSLVEAVAAPDLVFRDHPPGVRSVPGSRLLRPGGDAALALEARNLRAPATVAELAIGKRTRQRDSELPAAGITNRFVPWKADPPRGDIADRGGLTLAGVRGSPESGFAVAVAPFNVIAAGDGQRVMVWATDWDSAAAIANASIELLKVTAAGRETVLARGRTGADGVGYVPAPKDEMQDEQTQTRLVRVRHDGRQAVMPVLSAWSALPVAAIPEREWDDGRFYGAAVTAPVFGVSDRLLYRPGETVHFRLWARQREGNRLRPLAGKVGDDTAMVLRKLGEQAAIDAWSAPRDGWGSAEGERVLSSQLSDGSYCITRADDAVRTYRPSGACFDVARFDSQAVWVSSAFDRKVARPGGELALDIEGGFYSGGGAAGARVDALAFLAPTPLGSIYPEFARFTFASPLSEDGDESVVDPLATLAPAPFLDGRGKARLAGRLPPRMLLGDGDEQDPDQGEAAAIGEIRVNTSVTIPGAASSASPVASVVYAAFDRYVGLRSEGWWLASNEDPRLEAMVATAEGQAVTSGTVRVRIERDGDDDDAPEVLARCELAVGAVAPCAFRAPEPGEYRFVAEADGAAPAVFTRYFYGGTTPSRPDAAATAELTLLTPPAAGGDAVLRLLQPHARASALFVVEYENVLRHWVQEVGPDTQVRVAMPPEWAPGVSVRVLLRPVSTSPSTGAPEAKTLNAIVRVPVPRTDAGKVAVTLGADTLAPGEDLVVRLANGSASPRLVTLAIVDDSVHQQAAELHGALDPNGRRFIGLLEDWSGATWHGFGAWSRVPNLFVSAEEAPQEAPLVRSEASPVYGFGGESATLDTIQVTGSRIKRSDMVDSKSPGSAPPREATSAEGPPAARVRSRFPVTAYWNAGEELAPGETRELRVRLPDNLTRWRLVYWTSDDADGFALGQETFVATLPLEIRAGLPTRLFQGDQGSGTVLARVNAEGGAEVSLEVNTEGAGADGQVKAKGTVAPQASLARRVPLVPDAQGRIALLARAATATTSDALSSVVEVQSRLAPVSITQAGWLEDGPLALSRPDVPQGAMSPVLAVTIAQGTDPWRDGWLRDLRDYPHRCWEQTLSRGIGAALALQSPDSAAAWPDAREVVAATLRDAPSFMDEDGQYRFFPGGYSEFTSLDPVLSAHTLRGFQLLDALGHKVPMAWREHLREQLARFARISRPDEDSAWEAERVAIAAGALATDGQAVGDEVVPRLWWMREEMSWFGRSELVRAAAANPRHAALAVQGLQELRDAGTVRGARRILTDTGDWSMLMGSPLRDQCAITATLFTLDRSPEHLGVRQQWLRGLSDLYAGGTGSLDTQSSVQCLLALRAAGAALDTSGTARVGVTAGLQSTELALAAGEKSARWETPLAPTAELSLSPRGGSDGTLNYSAQVSYVLDQRDAVAQATGLQLQRSYQVMRGGEWRELGTGAVTEGEWLRTTLTVVVPAMRHFVAITDTVPGGLVTRDVRLGGVAGENMQRLADPGSWWFDTRQTGASEVRFYAQQLPPGTHDLHYYTQATHAGRYFAPPAVAELMYGRNSRASTVSSDLQVKPRP